MKPSTHKKIKQFKRDLSKYYYKIMYPLAWVINKIEDYNYKRLKQKSTVEYVAKLFGKEAYKYMCSNHNVNNYSAYIAEYVDDDMYNSASDAFEDLTRYKSKARKAGKILGIHSIRPELCEQFLNLAMIEFEKLNEYTYVEKVIEDVKHKRGLRAYKYTYQFGIKEDIKNT